MSPASSMAAVQKSAGMLNTAGSTLCKPTEEPLTPRKSKAKAALSSKCRRRHTLHVAPNLRLTKRNKSNSSEGELSSDSKCFKSSNKVKRYLEDPFKNPHLERSRLNAINAKVNRDRKKQEMRELMEKCQQLQGENLELTSNNERLEQRLRSAEEELAFLRRVVMERLGVQDLRSECKIVAHAAVAGG